MAVGPDIVRAAAARAHREAQWNKRASWVGLYDRLARDCHPKQGGMVREGSLRWCALVGRGGGKTTGCMARLIRRCVSTDKAQCLYIATTRGQCIDLMWEPLHTANQEYGLGAKFHETRLRMTFPNGSWIQLAGADNKREIEKYRGIPFHEVIVDESGSYPADLLERLIYRVIEPRLGDFNGSLGLVGTPSSNLRGPFYDFTRPGSEAKGWAFHNWTLKDGAAASGKWQKVMQNLWDTALKGKEDKGWSDDHPVWRREYLGLWAADDTEMVFKYRAHLDDGEPWNQWDPTFDSRGLAILPGDQSEWRYIYAMDEGYKDPFALTIWAFNPYVGELLQVYGFEQREMYADRIATLLLGEEHDNGNPKGLIGATGWPISMIGDMGPALQHALRTTYGVNVKIADRKANYKHDAIELTNGDLIDGRMKVLKDSKLEEQMQTLQWDQDDYGHLKENKNQANHSTDTAIYARMEAFHHHVMPRPVEGPKMGTFEAEKKWSDDKLAELLQKGQEDDFGEGAPPMWDDDWENDQW